MPNSVDVSIAITLGGAGFAFVMKWTPRESGGQAPIGTFLYRHGDLASGVA